MNVLFLCHENMCLSPLAEGILKKIFAQNNIESTVDSAGFEAYHINEPPDPKAIKMAKEHGIDISGKRVRMFSSADFDLFDKIYVMDTHAYRDARYFAKSETDKKKIDFLMNLLNPGKNQSVPDPFFSKHDSHNVTFDILEQGCKKIASQILGKEIN